MLRGVPSAQGCPMGDAFPRAEIMSFILSCLAHLGVASPTALPRHHLCVAHLHILVQRGGIDEVPAQFA